MPAAPPLVIRALQTRDLDAVAAIYADAVRDGTGTFELDAPDRDEMARRHAAVVDQGWPWLVAERGDGRIAGYAYAAPFRARPAYRYTLEDSVYVGADARGGGVGRSLLDQLIARCVALGARQMLAVIGDTDNAASIALHRAAGFVPVGTFRDVGRKFDRWIDVVLMQRPLGPGADRPPDA